MVTTEVEPDPEADASTVTQRSEAAHGWGWGRWFWRSLTSMRTAVILLALLAVAAIPGSVLPQRNVATDPMSVMVFAGNHPTLYPWLDRLGLFDVYASPWFAAIYLLLLVSMTGCVLPRCLRLWRAVRTPPPPAPRSLGRFEGYRSWTSDRDSDAVLADARTVLRRHRFRVVSTSIEVRAERGYLREVGNLLFHLSLLVLLFGVAAGRLLGFEGRVALAEGSSFTNVPAEYDVFTPSVWTDRDNLEPFSMTLDDFEVEYELEGSKRGEPRLFAAAVSYLAGTDGVRRQVEVSPNNPLDVNETKMFLTGHGYAPRVTVRDGTGAVAFSGPVMFLPNDATYASDGVVKAADAKPTQLGFEGFFLPTAVVGERGPYSAFPDALNPQLVLTAFTGDLGLGSGQPQSVFSLDKSALTQVREEGGKPYSRALSVGETMTLPDGQGSLTFDGVSRFANFQIAYDPGKEISLLAAVMLLVGLTTSLCVRRRRTWVRVTCLDETGPGRVSRVEIAGLSLTRRATPDTEWNALRVALGDPALNPTPTAREVT